MRLYRAVKRCFTEIKKRGQATIEYVLMLATVVVVLAAAMTTFHTDIARWFFTFVGIIYEKR